MVNNKKLLIGYKMFFGLLGGGALVTEVVVLIERGRFNPINFFSYFTVEANIIVAVVLVLSALATAGGKGAKLTAVRSAAAVYILIVGLGFSLLLAGLENTEFTALPWNNIVLHYIMPLAMLVDLIIDRPKRKLAFGRCLRWLLFPVVYVAYALTRGALTGWYPYPFLDPNTKGYGAVAFIVSSLLVLALGLTWSVSTLVGKKQRTQ